jgi:hypothetical protein
MAARGFTAAAGMAVVVVAVADIGKGRMMAAVATVTEALTPA